MIFFSNLLYFDLWKFRHQIMDLAPKILEKENSFSYEKERPTENTEKIVFFRNIISFESVCAHFIQFYFLKNGCSKKKRKALTFFKENHLKIRNFIFFLPDCRTRNGLSSVSSLRNEILFLGNILKILCCNF